MIFVFPLLLVAAATFVLRRRPSVKVERRPRWFAAWALAGFAVSFSFVTGLSIGLFVLPVAAVVVLWVARHAPQRAESIGFLAGVGVLLIVVADINRASDHGLDPLPWLVAGLALMAAALAAYAVARR